MNYGKSDPGSVTNYPFVYPIIKHSQQQHISKYMEIVELTQLLTTVNNNNLLLALLMMLLDG